MAGLVLAARRLMAREYDWPVVARQIADFHRQVAARTMAQRCWPA